MFTLHTGRRGSVVFFLNFTCKVHLNSTETGVHGSIEEASGHHFKDFRRFGEQLYLYCKLLQGVH